MLQVDEAQACLEQAQKYWQSKQWQKTIQACAQTLALNQDSAQAHKLMGDALQRTDRAKEAIGYYEEAIKLQPNFVEVYANLGTLYARQKQYQLAIDYYQQALKVDPDLTAVKKHLAKANLLLQQQLNQVSNSPQSAKTLNKHLEQGQNLQQQGELKAALEQYLTAAKLKPQRVETYKEIVKLCESLGLWSEAAKYCRLMLKLTNATKNLQVNLKVVDSRSPDSPKPLDLSGQKRLNIVPSLIQPVDSALNAIAVNKAVNQVVPDSQQYHELLEQGRSFASQGKHESAITYYRQAIEQEPKLIDAYLVLGQLLVQSSQLKPAISCYLSGLKQQQHPQLYFALGNIYQGIQQWSRAALCYQKTVQYNPQHVQACHELGEVLSQQQKWSDAVKAYRQAIALKTEISWSYNNLGYALIQLARWSEAIPAYRQAIKLNPDFPWSYYNLAEAYSKLDRWTEAIAVYQQAVKLQADLPQVQQKLGDAFYRRSQQDRQRALDCFTLAIEQDPHNPEAYHQALTIDNRNVTLYLKLGDLLAESGKPDRALVTYQMALQVQPQNIDVLGRIQQYQLNSALSYLIAPNSQDKIDYAVFAAELQSILPHSDSPEVSIVIPVYNQLDYTLRCLKAIAVNLDRSIPVEIILVNDCSTDRTQEILSPLTAVKLINQPANQGFIYACNQGAAIAKGKYLYFLNNDTQIKPNCIAPLVEVLVADETVGAVGSKLIYPQGSLQEAGAIVWQDGSGWNYGREENPLAPEYNYLRPVDYCSGASLMVKKEVFERLAGFATNFAPAYYEDTDLCFAIRHQLGMKVMYQPKSEVIHYEGISSGTSLASGTKKYQAVNAIKFQRKWQANLQQDCYLSNMEIDRVSIAARKHLGSQTILVIDSYMPSYDRESGSRRLFELLKIFKGLNYHVIFAADNGLQEEPYTSILQDLQIEVLYTQAGYGTGIKEQIESRLNLIDLAWICRPELNQKYTSIIRQKPEIKLIYDTIDLHYLRLKRAWAIDPNHCTKEQWVEMQAQELKMAHLADLTITVTATEQKILETQGVDRVAVIPNIHLAYNGDLVDFEHREGILFIGSYNHLPNVDAALWLCQEIMPLVWQIKPEIKVTLLGNNPSAEVLALESDRIIVTGYIDDVSPYFLSHKLSVSPLRYGAGMKGKIGQSLEYSLPVVSTQIGTEGMNLVPEQDILEASNSLNFARQILRLYTDKSLWNSISSNSHQAIASYSPNIIKEQLRQVLEFPER
jgi:O-antigen biosynthesis protein